MGLGPFVVTLREDQSDLLFSEPPGLGHSLYPMQVLAGSLEHPEGPAQNNGRKSETSIGQVDC